MKYRNGNREDIGNAEKEKKKNYFVRDNSGVIYIINEKPTALDTNFPKIYRVNTANNLICATMEKTPSL